VEACSDTQAKPKPPWLQRKQRYLDHLKEAPPDVLLVSLADKLHNARALLLDLRTEGPHVFNRFNAGPGETLWYYQKLAALFMRRCQGPLAEELARVVGDLHEEVSEAYP
jgi:(p)ppGpp synthase/HD superfamily hydrolase